MTINGKVYNASDIGYWEAVQFAQFGTPLEKAEESSSFAILGAYAAICMGTNLKTACQQLGEHVTNGGSLDEITEALGEKLSESGFFRALSEKAETD